MANDTNLTNGSIFEQTNVFVSEKLLTRSVTALLILICGLLVGKLLERFIIRIFAEMGVNKSLAQILRKDMHFGQLIGSTAAYITYIATIILTLNQLRLTAFVLDFISVIVIVIVVIVMILSFKDFVKNVAAGLALQHRYHPHIGDVVFIENTSGRIISTDLFMTTIKTSNGDIIQLPSSYMFVKKAKIVPKRQ